MATFQSGGLTLAYDDIGSGEAGTAVLVHGFATSRAENWKRLGWYASFERKGYRAVALDLRGHGESDKPHEASAYGRANMLGDVLALMDHLGIEQANLLGFSMGSHLSLRLALQAPERVSNLILGGVGERMLPNAPPQPSPTMTMREAMTTDDPSKITDATLKGFRQFADNEGADRLALAACSEGAGEALDADDLLRLRMPVLVVAGALDKIAGDPQALADAIPGAKAVTLPGCDHFSAIPHALFKASVFDFLEGWLDDDMPTFE
jgi:pimeloyl-ACP methyl ester carboxylesterase